MVVYAGLDASSGSPRAISASTSKYTFRLELPIVASTYSRTSSSEFPSQRQKTSALSRLG